MIYEHVIGLDGIKSHGHGHNPPVLEKERNHWQPYPAAD
jgi:hypothetical protein